MPKKQIKREGIKKIIPAEEDKVLMAKLLLKITFIMMVISICLKLIGFNYFDANQSNTILVFVSDFMTKYGGNSEVLRGILNFVLLSVQGFIIFRLSCENKNIKIYYLIAIITAIVTMFFQIVMYDYFERISLQLLNFARFGVDILIFLVFVIIIDIRIKTRTKIQTISLFKSIICIWKKIRKSLLVMGIIILYQAIVVFLRNLSPADKYDIVYNFIMNFDYVILLVTTYYMFIKKENNLKVKANFDFALAKILNQKPSFEEIMQSIKEIRGRYKNFKTKGLEYKITAIIYVFLFVIQEIITLGILIFIATINHYLIECLFIFSAFLISKSIFGAFHFKSFILCFFVSNITFFTLSKLTMEVNSTFVIPIICGILLSYIASRFIKNKNITPYRGMSTKDLSEICELKGLNKIETGILIDFYCEKETLVKISFKYHYTDRNIKKIKNKALEKLTS